MLTKESLQILKELRNITSLFESDIKEFINNFDTEDVFDFSNTEDKRKKALSIYSTFSITLNKHVNIYEKNVALISKLICEADKSCDLELTKKLTLEFERYTQLFISIKKFIKSCDSYLQSKDNTFKQSVIISSTRELLSAVTHYKNNFETC